MARNSIWKNDGTYPIGPNAFLGGLSESAWRLAWVNLAKLRIPPADFSLLPDIALAITCVPEQATEEEIVEFLLKAKGWKGVGVRMAICMLARETNGRFPPIDEKIVPGMRAWSGYGHGRTAMSPENETALLTSSFAKQKLTAFSKVYLGPGLNIWREAVAFYGGNQEADEKLSELR